MLTPSNASNQIVNLCTLIYLCFRHYINLLLTYLFMVDQAKSALAGEKINISLPNVRYGVKS